LEDGKVKGAALGDVIISLVMPATYKIQNAIDRRTQTQDNVSVAFALARYHCDQGKYPKQLDELTPTYLKQIPQDIFSGKSLLYGRTDNGYILYSVGLNGKDDSGHGPDDDPAGDDIVIRMPLPEIKQQ